MFKRLLKRIKSELKWRKTRREQAARAASLAVSMIINGALRRQI